LYTQVNDDSFDSLVLIFYRVFGVENTDLYGRFKSVKRRINYVYKTHKND